MASQTITLASSTPKLATFNSPTPTLLALPPPRSFSGSSSLPTPCLKASYGGIRVPQTSRDFKCYTSAVGAGAPSVVSGDGAPSDVSGGSLEILQVGDNEEVLTLSKYALEEYNYQYRTQYDFSSVVSWSKQVNASGIFTYDIDISVNTGTDLKTIKTHVSFGPFRGF